jgi:hypothetical protein
VTLFGASVAERVGETGTPERTLYRRVERFERDGMMGLFASDPAASRAKRRGLGLGERVLRVFNSAETGYEKPHPEAYRRVLRTLGDEVEAVRRVVGAGREQVCVPELCVSHGWRGYRRGLSHPTRARCLHV